MSTNSISFKRDIALIFGKLHSLLHGLETKIVEREESLREDIQQELLGHLSSLHGQLSPDSLSDKDTLISSLKSRFKQTGDPSSDRSSQATKSSYTSADSNSVSSRLSDDQSNQGILSLSSRQSCQQQKPSATGEVNKREIKIESQCIKCPSQCDCSSNVIQVPMRYSAAISLTSKPSSDTNCSESSTRLSVKASRSNVTTTSSNNRKDVKYCLDNNDGTEESDHDDEKFDSDEKDSDPRNPVSMVVPLDPNEFLGTHSKLSIDPDTINLTIKAGVSTTNTTSSPRESIAADEPFRTINNPAGINHGDLVVALDNHSKNNTNNRVKENRCPMCAQRFTQLNSLKRHIRSHTGERPFPCGYCEKRFVDRERLKVHVRIHTGEKPFSCNLCSRKFSQKSTVKRHMSVHTGLKPFQCASCSKRFGTRDNLKVHEKSHFHVDIKFKGLASNQVQQNDNLNYL